MNENDKDESILALLSALEPQRRGWVVVDHWRGDRCAVGVARASEPRRLVYVSTFARGAGRYDYECELPSGPGETDYDSVDRGENVSYDQLLGVLLRHLG